MKQASLKLKPLPNGDKIEQIITVLQNYIIDGILKPGDAIPPERQLASQLGVSRFSLREALRVAQTQGLIEIKQGRRPRVAQPSADAAVEVISLTLRRTEKALLDLVEARQNLECGIAKLAAFRARPEHIEQMRKTIFEMKNNKTNLNVCVDSDIAFHDTLIKASSNSVFEIMLKPLTELLKDSRRKTLLANGIDKAIWAHEEILEAIEQRDGEKAVSLMASHLEMAEEDLKKIEGGKHGKNN
jgi:DNA-binding FadR family transcriptional regulator